jgi:prephenate dehydrogenase
MAKKVVLLIGLGLIGGSLAQALSRRRDEYRVIAADSDTAVLVKAQNRGWIDGWRDRPEDAAAEADIAILCVPVCEMCAIAQKIGRKMKKGSVLSDVGSVKAFLLRRLAACLPPGVSYVGAHPMAGSEKSGLDAASADMFAGRPYVVIPSPQADRAATEAIIKIAEAIGAAPVVMEAEKHDSAAAMISHMPHVLSAALMLTAAGDSAAIAAKFLAAGCFRDMTRVSGADARMWTDICRANSRAIIEGIEKVESVLSVAKGKIAQEDKAWLMDFFGRARAGRDLFGLFAPEAKGE